MLVAAIMAVGLAGAPSSTECETAASDALRSRCLLQELEVADASINANYASLRASLEDAGKLILRDAQRAWIKRRDEACHLENSQGPRAVWLASLSADYGKTVCVVRFTNARAQELQARLAQPKAAPAPAAPAPSAEAYDVAVRTPRTTGKWYFEATLKLGDLARANEQALFVGVKSLTQNTGTLVTIHKRDAGREPINVGIAVDLDAGKLYIRRNGEWQRGAPGSSGGQDVKLGRPYRGWLTSSVSVNDALKAGAIDPNFGQRPFVYTVPDGYQPIDSQPPLIVSER